MCSGQRHPRVWSLTLGIFLLLDFSSGGHSASVGASVRPSVTPSVSPSLRPPATPPVSQTVVNAANTSSDAYGVITTSGYERDAKEEMLDRNYIVVSDRRLHPLSDDHVSVINIHYTKL